MKGVAAAAMAFLLVIAAVAYACSEKVEREEAGRAVPPAVLPLPAEEASAAVERLLRERTSPTNPAFRAFTVARAGAAIFPSEDHLAAAARTDPELRRYLAIPAADRKADLYFFEPSGDRYWPSEYVAGGEPLRFRCAFLVHFEPLSAARTRVDAFEYVPTVIRGKRFGWGAHGPGFFLDIRPVAPTASDRAQLLAWIAALR